MEKLIFVYNADSGIGNAILDTVKKYVSPESYQCSLCSVSYGPAGMKKRWKDFIESLPVETEFFHKDEFLEKYSVKQQKFPSLYMLKNGKVKLIEDLNKLDNEGTVEELKELVKNALEREGLLKN